MNTIAGVQLGVLTGLEMFRLAAIAIAFDGAATAGGIILGCAEWYAQGYISTQWSDLIVFSILVAFMVFRPQGLLGRADIRKV